MFRNLSRNFIFFGAILFAGSLCFGGYQAFKLTYTISGSTGIGGVVMKGLPGDPVCDADGFYSVTVDYGWKGTVTALKEGYEFSPASRNYAKIVGNKIYQYYNGSLIKLTISGSAGVIGAALEGFEGKVISDMNGKYTATVDYGWSGVVTAVKAGYSFEPWRRVYKDLKENKTDEDFVAELKTFTISGSTGLAGVVLSGFPEDVVTDSAGNYSVIVDYGWKGRVTAALEGYTFEPASKAYGKTVADHAHQDYTANRIMFTIAGNAGQEGVAMNGLADNTVSDARGNYSADVDYDFSGTVTPSKKGYIFSPASIDYSNLKHDKVNGRYTAKLKTFTVSGSAGMGGVVMTGLTGDPVTKNDGSYSVIVSYGWKGVVVPAKEGYSFEPGERVYEDISAKQIDQDYAGNVLSYIVSGVVNRDGSPVGGVVLEGLPGEPVTNEDGYYSVIVDYGWDGGAEPKKKGYTFKPEILTYSQVAKDYSQDYEATLLEFAISGVITAGDEPLHGVVVKCCKGTGIATTNVRGEYTIFVDYGFSGSVRAEKEGYTFVPFDRFTKVAGTVSERDYSHVVENQVKQDYAGTILTFTIYGTVEVGGEPVKGVLMTASNGGMTSLTDPEGKYSLTVDYGWSGEVSPSKEGYMFIPPSIAYENVTSDINEDVNDAEREAARKKAEEVAALEKAEEEVAAARKVEEEIAALEKVAAAEEKSVAEKSAEGDVGAEAVTGDVAERETELDIRIVTMDRSDLAGMKFELVAPKIKSGIVAGLQETKVDEPGESVKWPWGIQVGRSLEAAFSGSLGGILSDLAKAGKASIVSSPKVLTRDGETTEIKVTTEKYYILEDDSAEVDDSEMEKIEYQTVLKITPDVLPSGDIMLSLVIEISEVAIRGGDSQVVSRRVANDTVQIKAGGTILVASLNNDDGGADDSENVDEDVAIFVTGRLLPD